jgi:putative ABC transport system permease protein
MFLFEAAAIGGLGAAVGACLGAATCHVLTRAQIEMPPPPGYSHGYIVQVPMVGDVFIGAVLLATAAALIAGVGPSLRCVRGEVSDVLRAA